MTTVLEREVRSVTSSVDLDTTLALALTGDDAAFSVLYRALNPGLVRYLRVLVQGDAEDVASEAWLKACKQLGRFTGDADGFRGWLATIGRTTALDHLRALGRRPQSGAGDEVLARMPSAGDAADHALTALATQRALDLIGTLPQTQAEAVMLCSVMGLDAPSAGKVLGRRGGAVRMALSRGLTTLATMVDEPGVTPRARRTLEDS